MAREQSMAFYRSFYDVASLLPERGRCRVLTAMLDYYYEDVEPDLGANEAKVFEVVRGRIDKAKRCRDSSGGCDATSGGDCVGTYEGDGEGTAGETPPMTFGQSESESVSMSEKEHTPGAAPGKGARKRFAKPTVEEVAAYASERGLHGFDAGRFVDFYESKGWMVGRNHMKDWKAAVRNWAGRERKETRRYAKYD